jgi:hypothetical protein
MKYRGSGRVYSYVITQNDNHNKTIKLNIIFSFLEDIKFLLTN